MDRWTLYEACVQSAPLVADLLERAHGGSPRSLGEDFAGSAALSREWVRRGARATAVDLDDEALERARGVERLETLVANATDAALRERRADIVHAGNFSLGYLRERERLLDYLRLARARLLERGVFACDTYGGPSAFELGAWRRERFLEGGARVVSTWEHRSADPATGLVENALHFRVEREGEPDFELRDAFVYRWRLWSVAELRDALREAGFRSVELVHDLSGDRTPLAGDFSVLVVARK
jgi:hypothetical protein